MSDRAARSDNKTLPVATDTQIVMAEQITHDVVKEAQSMGRSSPIDDTVTSTNHSARDGGAPFEPTTANSHSSDSSLTASANASSATSAPADATETMDKTGEETLTTSMADSGDHEPSGGVAGDTKEHLANGDLSEQSASEDVSSQHAVGDASGGSDTDISRPGSVDQTKDRPAGHLRSNSTSIKKPTSFKSVSVTKSFLAKSATPVPSAKPGEKSAPTGQTSVSALQAARPRLVAKSGTGMGSLGRAAISKLNGASGPDASKVWNKNQPIPPPPPKQFTDEELKQQYGIHLATRLQADDSGKEAKWADIDDDEDDWAPETVEWMDGTKSTVAPAAENEPPPVEEPKPVPQKEEAPLEVEPPKPVASPSTNGQRPTSTSGTKTILKPGLSATGTTKTGLVQKGQPDKPTLVAKPSAPTPVKSPWAALPPVEKVSPVVINPPAQQASSRYMSRDSHGYDAMPPPHGPAKEIAPDDFNRSWRDDRGNRELFNSHSGRYEPVNEMRRGSVREGNYRQQPAVLQRPSHDGPAEPSAAFQTSRNSADAPPTWGRRRNSSNVSGGSGRRMSIDRRAPEHPLLPMNIQRRGSQSINGADASGTPRSSFSHKGAFSDLHNALPEQLPMHASPSLSNVQPGSPLGSVASQDIAVHSAPPLPPALAAPVVPVQTESPVEVQNRLMREKLERARLAKQKEKEQEEKEEAEKKERLRKKLEALGLADSSKPKSKEQTPAHAVAKSPQKEKAVPAPMQSPPKPPVPTSEGEVAQYGMMKVHQPHPVKKGNHGEAVSKPYVNAAPKLAPSPGKSHAEVVPKPATTPSLTEATPHQPLSNLNRENNRNVGEHSQGSVQPPVSESLAGHPAHKSAPPAAWTPSSLAQQPRPWISNVWGPPQTKERALGNGTFDSSYNRSQPRSGSQQLPVQPLPGASPAIALNAQLKPSQPQSQDTSTRPFVQPNMYTKTETLAAQKATIAPPVKPIAPPAPAMGGGWGNFAAAIRQDDQDMMKKKAQDIERYGGKTARPEMREKFIDHTAGSSQHIVHSKIGSHPSAPNAVVTQDTTQASIAQEPKQKDEVIKTVAASGNDAPSPQVTLPTGAHLPTATQAARSSRFFPRQSESTTQSSVSPNINDSPPPPETESHPAFAGDLNHPVVRMPKPTARVRLPPAVVAEPAAAATAEVPVTMPSRARLGLGARPLALDPEWQARFNSLLDKPQAPSLAAVPAIKVAHAGTATKAGSLAIAASSKAPLLDVREHRTSATVSLPNAPPNVPARRIFAVDSSREVTTCPSAEVVLLEEREFGSLPIVRLSKVPHLAAHEPAVGFPSTRPNSRFPRHMDITTKSSLYLLDDDRNAETIDVIIRLANMNQAITKAVPKKRGNRRGPSSNKPKRNFTPTNSPSGPSQTQRPPRKSTGYQGQASNSSSNVNGNAVPLLLMVVAAGLGGRLPFTRDDVKHQHLFYLFPSTAGSKQNASEGSNRHITTVPTNNYDGDFAHEAQAYWYLLVPLPSAHGRPSMRAIFSLLWKLRTIGFSALVLHPAHPNGKKPNPYARPSHPNHNPTFPSIQPSATSSSATRASRDQGFIPNSEQDARSRPASPRGGEDFLAEARMAVGRNPVTGRARGEGGKGGERGGSGSPGPSPISASGGGRVGVGGDAENRDDVSPSISPLSPLGTVRFPTPDLQGGPWASGANGLAPSPGSSPRLGHSRPAPTSTPNPGPAPSPPPAQPGVSTSPTPTTPTEPSAFSTHASAVRSATNKYDLYIKAMKKQREQAERAAQERLAKTGSRMPEGGYYAPPGWVPVEYYGPGRGSGRGGE
ncbi:hypothetical protein P154DRAFT_624469 [Amniculicola lignicola CBS 123094]|uniref:Uncharacterized protein n=1 Tax=Amniculicola lignicola CBS 123094 TaxID=1392246 RepID=A0A6A5WB20_9PLEO|nr:hypothetical protein P154DRAFT_624469 [Amniculicola lignicola CBS 123094]